MKLSINNRVLWFYFDTKLRIYGISLFGAGVGITTTKIGKKTSVYIGMALNSRYATSFKFSY